MDTIVNTNLDSIYWDNRYLEQQTGWDIGYPSTPLKEYFDQLKDKSNSILIPGCGNAYEAAYLLEQGFTNVTLVDISPVVTAKVAEQLHQYLHQQLTIITGDFFQLKGNYDLVVEQTFFCAIDPAIRPLYVKKVKELLAPKGKMVGVLFNRDFPGGPPFGGSKEEYELLFKAEFSNVKIEPCYNSIKPRQGSELFISIQ
ncbi:methyltransferase [Aridibaculum aurantiacum]|uniref:methyltransferase n=1 Tax=Aridibaculum aurantiacum TaxID=2810307 RepID=UPI001A964E73|nr:methyltransferase [Aridibaculum aurantiacum]